MELDVARARAKQLANKDRKRAPTEEEKQIKTDLDLKAKRAKAQLLSHLRAEVTEEQFAWLDVCMRLIKTQTRHC